MVLGLPCQVIETLPLEEELALTSSAVVSNADDGLDLEATDHLAFVIEQLGNVE